MYADKLSDKMFTSLRKTLMTLSAPQEPDSDDSDEEDDDETYIERACYLLYRLIFTRVGAALVEPEDLKKSTSDCLTDLLDLFTQLGCAETREMLVQSVRHALSFLVGPQLISSAETKAMVFRLLPGMNNPAPGFEAKGSNWPPVSATSGAPPSLVKALQYLLNSVEHEADKTLEIDGVFGAKTAAIVKTLQISQNLEPTGVVDAMMWMCLVGPLKKGSSGLPVLALRCLLPEYQVEGLEPEAEGKPDPEFFDPMLLKSLQLMCKAVGGWLVMPQGVAEK